MTRHDEIKGAYKALGKEANFYDGMMTCSTVLGTAVSKLPFPDESFDIVLSMNGFHAFPDYECNRTKPCVLPICRKSAG